MINRKMAIDDNTRKVILLLIIKYNISIIYSKSMVHFYFDYLQLNNLLFYTKITFSMLKV